MSAQQEITLATERRAYAEWLSAAKNSPLAAVAMQRVGGGLLLGPDSADIPLKGFGPASVTEAKGVVTLAIAGGRSRFLPRGRPVSIGPYTFQVFGPAGGSVLLVYGEAEGTPPGWYPVEDGNSFLLELEPATSPVRRRVLTLDGLDVEAEEAGHLQLPIGPSGTRLLVMRMPVPGTEETELQVYFRDQTNDRGTYPAGRFVEVTRTADGRYRLDLNRARNPFCAYSSVYPCPVPWPGNSVAAAIEAGEKYLPQKSGS